MNWNVQFVALGVVHLKVFALDPAQFKPGKAFIHTDAMLHMNDIIVRIDVGKKEFRSH